MTDTQQLPAVVPGAEVPAARASVAEQAHEYARQAKAENTRRAYRADCNDFADWCQANGLDSLPASSSTIALYLTARAETHKPATLRRRLTAITQAHKAKGHGLDTRAAVVREVWAGIKRVNGTAPSSKAPVLPGDIRSMVAALPDSLKGARDRALLLVGFAGAFRRSELVALDVEDIADVDEGLVVTIRRSKTDQEGEGRKVGISYGGAPSTCPVRSLRTWLGQAGIADGPLFRPMTKGGRMLDQRLSDKAVALVVKRTAEAIGLDPARYAGHSLRAGLATAAAGASERSIMAQTGHRSLAMVRRYIREGSLFRDNAAARVGL